MLNTKKIRHMTNLAIYEKKEGREDIKLSTFYKSDYVRYHLLKTCISATIAYLLVLVMIVVIAVGAYYVWSWQLKSEEAKDRNNDNLSCSNCNSRGLCSSPGVPCSRHQNWQ